MIVDSNSVEETRELGRLIGAIAPPGTVLALIGDLGAGKTQFAKGVAVGLGVPDADVVTSPTFVLMNSYQGRVPIRHYDLYRIDGRELDTLGFPEFRESSVILIEWAEKAWDLGDALSVRFEVVDETRRRLTLEARGPRSTKLLNFRA